MSVKPMDEAQVTALIDALKHMQTRPGAFMNTNSDIDILLAYLDGFRLAARALDIEYSLEMRKEVVEEHGWEFTAMLPISQMREKGMGEEEIFKEFFQMEIEVWQKLKDQL